MNLHETQLVAYAAGSVIHGVLAVLVWRAYRHASGVERSEAVQRMSVCVAGFLWQFGNLWHNSGVFFPFVGNLLWYAALSTFPLLLGYGLHDFARNSGARFLATFSRALRYPLWAFTLVVLVSLFLSAFGRLPLIDLNVAVRITMNTMLIFFLVFILLAVRARQRLHASGDAPSIRSNRAAMILMPVMAGMFMLALYYPGALRENSSWIELAVGMMTVPSTIGTAYRLYRFPFMDVFLRETLTGVTLLTAFCVGFSVRPGGGWNPLWIASLAMGLGVARAPLSRWVERAFLGYGESAEDQEERVGTAIRGVQRLAGFDAHVSEILRDEMDAEWVRVSTEDNREAAFRGEIPGSPPHWLLLGQRRNARPYMSRHLRLARRSALEIAAQRQRLEHEESERRTLEEHHELREITTRAQMRALQAQINPHFLFNTLNTLAALIAHNPEKAERVTEDLAEVFRYALESTRLDRVPLDDELKFLEAYLAIEKARFTSRLSYSFDVDPAVRKTLIPPMLLQPLVENAVRHGIGQKLEGGEVRVIAHRNGAGLIIRIEDTGVGFVRERPGGVGLSNTRQRLHHAYGDSGTFRIERLEPEGTRMEIVLKQ